MTEEQKPSPEVPGEEQTTGSEVLGEIQSLGQQLAQAVKSLWESEESRELRQEIGDGFVGLGRQMEDAVKSAQDSEAVQKFEEQVKGTVSKARESDVATKLEQGLVSGLGAVDSVQHRFSRTRNRHIWITPTRGDGHWNLRASRASWMPGRRSGRRCQGTLRRTGLWALRG